MSQPELAGAVESRLRNLDGVKWAKYGPDVLRIVSGFDS